MIMRGLGGVRSFNISPVFVFCVVLFFIAFTIASLFAINGFLHLRRWTAVQKREINQLRKKADHRLKELLEVKQRMALLTSYVRDLENPQKVKRVLVPEEKPVPQKEAQPPVPGKPATQLVDVRGIAVRKEGSRMTVDFRLINLAPPEKAVGGYVHTLIKIEDSNPPRLMIFPKQKQLESGLPVNYRRGQPFLIHRFRPIKAGFDLTSIPQPPSSIRVLVYGQSGKLLLSKVFAVSEDS